MSDSVINVSGADQSYAVDAIRPGAGTGDYRQVVCVGDFTNSGIEGAVASISASALCVSSVGEKENGNTMSYASFSFSGAGGAPASNQAIISAPGANKSLLIHGYQTNLTGVAGATDGYAMLTDGDDGTTNRVYISGIQGENCADHSIMLKYPIQLTTNTALKATTDEQANHLVFLGTVFYTTIDV